MASKARIDDIVATGLLCEPVNGVVNRMWPGQYTSHTHTHTHSYQQSILQEGRERVIAPRFPRDDFILPYPMFAARA